MRRITIFSTIFLGIILMWAVNVFAASTDYSYVEGTQTISLSAGNYTFEAWGKTGANGVGGYDGWGDWTPGGNGGPGGYAKGSLILTSPATIYVVGTSGVEEVRLNTNTSANDILKATAGTNGGDATFSGDDGWAGADGAPGTGWVASSLAYPLTGTATGTPLVRITSAAAILSISNPIAPTAYSAQPGYKTITVSGQISSLSGGSATISATIAGKTKSQVVNPISTSIPVSDNFTLTWDVVSDGISPGAYTNYSGIVVTADTGANGTVTTTLPTLTVDNVSPTVNALTTKNVQSSFITVQANASDSSGSVQYMFNIGGVDQGTWQSSNTYTFNGLSPSTTYSIKYKAKDNAGNISNYSGVLSVTTGAATYYAYYEGTMPFALSPGIYTIESWGKTGTNGVGGYDDYGVWEAGGSGGLGGYSKGTLTLASSATIYIVGTSGMEEVRLSTNSSANDILKSTPGTNGGDWVSYGDGSGSPGTNGTPGAGWVASSLTNPLTGTAAGGPLVRIVMVDTTPPTVNDPTSGSITDTSFVGIANASDPSTPLQYLFNLNGSDVGTWQSGSTYTFTGLTKSTNYTIKYKAKDSAGNISGYSNSINVTTLAFVPVVVSPAVITEVRDLYNNNDASDIRIIFKGASNESKIAAYKVIVALAGGTQPTDSVGASLTTLATNSMAGNYASEPKKGNGRLHLFMLPSKLQTYDNNPISGALKVYVLSVATTGNSDKLSASGDLASGLTGNNDGGKIIASTPVAVDIDNSGTGSDMRVTFKKPQSEMNIQEYRVIVSTVDLTAATAASVPLTGYKKITPTGIGLSYTVTMGNTQTDNGGVTQIGNSVIYKVYILAVGKNGYANVLSSASRPITLLTTVPAALPVRNLTAVKTGSGHAGSNISVTFSEPLSVTNVQEYRVFICTGVGSFDSVTAAGLINTRYIKVDSTGRGTSHTVTLTGLNNIYDGTVLATGDYKVYVLTVGKTSTYAGKLAGPSRIVKLD